MLLFYAYSRGEHSKHAQYRVPLILFARFNLRNKQKTTATTILAVNVRLSKILKSNRGYNMENVEKKMFEFFFSFDSPNTDSWITSLPN